jgi:hypothetical protein
VLYRTRQKGVVKEGLDEHGICPLGASFVDPQATLQAAARIETKFPITFVCEFENTRCKAQSKSSRLETGEVEGAAMTRKVVRGRQFPLRNHAPAQGISAIA